MSNLQAQLEAEQAILDCKKTLFECALQREQLKMSKQIAKKYMEDKIISEDVDLNTAIIMQEELEDIYYTEEGGILSTIWTTIKEMFKKLRNWLFGEKAPSTKPSDYSVKEVKSDTPVDVKDLDSTMKDIEKLTKELGNVDDLEKASAAADSLKEKFNQAIKPDKGKKVMTGAISITLLVSIFASGVVALKNAEKTAADLEVKMKNPSTTEEEKDKIQKKINILNKITGVLASVQKFVTNLLHKAEEMDNTEEDNKDPKDNTEEDNKDPKDNTEEDNKDPKDNTEEDNKDPKDGNAEDNKDPKDGNAEDNKDPKDNTEEDNKDTTKPEEPKDTKPKKPQDIEPASLKDDLILNDVRRDWFMWKFRYACTEKDLGKLSRNIKPILFPPNLRDEMKDKKELTVADLNKIGSTLGVDLRLIPDNYATIQKELKTTADIHLKRAANIQRKTIDWYTIIPYSWWSLKNPYRIPFKEREKLSELCYSGKLEELSGGQSSFDIYNDVFDTYAMTIGYRPNEDYRHPEEPRKRREIADLGWYD